MVASGRPACSSDAERRGATPRVLIEGDAANDMIQAFDRMWRRAAGRSDAVRTGICTRRARSTHLDPSVHPPALVGIIEGEPGRFRISRALQIQAVSAERSIWIASAYFMPSASEVEALTGAARDGVDVRVLVPSRYDHPWIRLATRHFYRRLLRNGVRIWEWRGEMMHAKTSVVDGRWTRIGSTDYNPLGHRHQLRARRGHRGSGAWARRRRRCSSRTSSSRRRSRSTWLPHDDGLGDGAIRTRASLRSCWSPRAAVRPMLRCRRSRPGRRPARANVRVEVNATAAHQVMEGFGATTVPLIYQNGTDDKLPPALRTRALQAVYRDVRLTLGNVGDWAVGAGRTTTPTRCT